MHIFIFYLIPSKFWHFPRPSCTWSSRPYLDHELCHGMKRVFFVKLVDPFFKGTVSRDFLLLVFLWISYSPAPEYPIRTVSNFFQNSLRYSQLKVDHRCRWHRWQMKKIFNQKNFINFVGTHLDSRVNMYINFCLQVHFKVSSAWY